MPTYEYIREDGTTFEIKQSINDEPLKKCPDTGQDVKRIISGGGGVVYKGSGFYVTDYKNGGRNKKAGGEKNTDNGEAAANQTDSASTEKNEKD